MKDFFKSFLPAYFHPGTKKLKPSKIFVLCFLVFLALVPFHSVITGKTWFTKIFLTANIFAIFAVSWDILSGYTGQENIGHHFFVGIGAFLVGLFTVAFIKTSSSSGVTHAAILSFRMPDVLIIILGGFLSSIFGILIGIPCLKLKGPYLALATLSMGLLFHEFVDKVLPVLHPNLKAHATETIMGIPQLTGSLTSFYYLVFFVMLASVFIIYSYSRSHYGLVLKAIKIDEPASKAMGINTTFYKVAVFSASAFFAGIGGALFAYSLNSIAAPTVETQLTLKIISMAVVGGMGTISGSFGGAYFLIFITWIMNDLTRALSTIPGLYSINTIYKKYEDIFYYGLIIIVLLFMPQGVITSLINNMRKILKRIKTLILRIFKRGEHG